MTSSVTADFREAWVAERSELLRRRFRWYVTLVVAMQAAQAALLLLLLAVSGGRPTPFALTNLLTDLVIPAMYLYAFHYARRHRPDRDELLRWVYWLIVLTGAIVLVPLAIFARRLEAELFAFGGVGGLLYIHLLASCFLPWTAREAIRPLIPLLILNAVLMVFVALDVGQLVATLVVSLLVGVPGVAIAALRHSSLRSRFQLRMLKGHYGEMKRELGEARRIHEALFPDPVREGPVRFEYRYLPMRQIGGDYLFARIDGGTVLNVVLIDVTGHGLSAALTVNRLAGEIERELGEAPDRQPAELLEGLNAYVHHTLARHSVYATAICIRVDASRDVVEWASAGHPPAFLRAVDGKIERLESTTIVLGACHGNDFPRLQRSTRFARGDTILAYTDGAIEARDASGRMLNIEGLQAMIATGHPDRDGGWAAAMLREIDRFRHGPVQDDMLVVEVYRPLEDPRP